MSYLYFPLIRSAALRNMAARSVKGMASHCAFAASAESMACATSEAVAFEYWAIALEWEEGFNCVEVAEVLIWTDILVSHSKDLA